MEQYCANLPWHSNANITWLLVLGLKNSSIIWWFSSWISTSLSPAHVCWYGSDNCHLILETEVNYLQLVGSCCRGFCMRTSITSFVSVFLLRDAFCVLADAVACSSHLKCARIWNWIRKFVCVSGFALWELSVCLCLTAAFEQFSFVLFENNGLLLLFGLCGNMILLARKVCVLE